MDFLGRKINCSKTKERVVLDHTPALIGTYWGRELSTKIFQRPQIQLLMLMIIRARKPVRVYNHIVCHLYHSIQDLHNPTGLDQIWGKQRRKTNSASILANANDEWGFTLRPNRIVWGLFWEGQYREPLSTPKLVFLVQNAIRLRLSIESIKCFFASTLAHLNRILTIEVTSICVLHKQLGHIPTHNQ